MKPEILYGPYGTCLKEKALKQADPEIKKFLSHLWHSPTRRAILETGQEYVRAGATVITTPTYGLGRILTRETNEAEAAEFGCYSQKTFEEILRETSQLVTDALPRNFKPFLKLINFSTLYDAFQIEKLPTVAEAREFHTAQIAASQKLSADGCIFEAVNSGDEALGIALASARSKIYTVISFLVDKKGNLHTGERLQDVIRRINSTCHGVLYGINCCPPSALRPGIISAHQSAKSFGGADSQLVAIYPNASSCDLNELNGSPNGIIRTSSPHKTAQEVHRISQEFNIRIMGGCCGNNPPTINIFKCEILR